MNPMQEINLAYEMYNMLQDNWTIEEALTEIKLTLETEYRREILSEVDELILYGWNEVVSDILANIQALLARITNSMVLS